jgi:hypothetical protein
MKITTTQAKQLYWVVDQNPLMRDEALQGFETRLEAEFHMANLEHRLCLTYLKVMHGTELWGR